MELNLKFTKSFVKINEAYEQTDKRFCICQGGARSGKTTAILMLLLMAMCERKVIITVVRNTFAALRGSAYRDFINLLKEYDIYDEGSHNRTEHFYEIKQTGSIIEFIGADDPHKLRGRKRNIVFINEADALTLEQFTEINVRTEGDNAKVILDFNPSEVESWIYDLMKRENAVTVHSTYKDNEALTKEQVAEIENLINVDPSYYAIYALGEKPQVTRRIYNHFKRFDNLPDKIDATCYGLDFGFANSHTALVKVDFANNRAYVEELIFKRSLTSVDLIELMNSLNVSKNKKIFCDYARPEIIEDLKRAGYNAQSANKDVNAGIDSVRSTEVYIQMNSENIMKEYKVYFWKMKGEQIDAAQKPVKQNDDLMDAIRYAIYSSKKNLKPFNKRVYI